MINRSLWSRDPFADLARMAEQMDRAFDGYLRTATPTGMGNVPIDVYEKEDSLYVCAAVPGVKPDELDITVADRTLTIRGEIKQNWESDEQTRVYRREQQYGQFSRSLRLPDGLDLDRTEAEFNDGFVTIRLPKLPQQREEAKRIPIRTNASQPPALDQHSKNGAREKQKVGV